jgi:hypothetical protein
MQEVVDVFGFWCRCKSKQRIDNRLVWVQLLKIRHAHNTYFWLNIELFYWIVFEADNNVMISQVLGHFYAVRMHWPTTTCAVENIVVLSIYKYECINIPAESDKYAYIKTPRTIVKWNPGSIRSTIYLWGKTRLKLISIFLQVSHI